ncbi:MAG TPA: tryptophan-rich sensory protein [Candidatus Paceibacterota bacterium]|nr:tryptophan-rich sensory protein [Candidatus Pacearchaeota archaeon]HRZ50615.1 tryptophan-rich sensory protein [Candidatus Paceibacterota bacterium]HSA36488.1 tryptophan-rich sensory protein [Candidatus Paceibacterota bacterium]
MKNIFIKIFAAAAYVAMVGVNFLANGLPINNRTTGAVSEAYPNLFAPAGLTFSIWGLIYLLLGGYVVYQFTKGSRQKEELLSKINLLFIATSLANISWIFAWHYDLIGLSVIIMAALLALLIKIADILRPEKLASRERFVISTPFGVYFGWITVAAIANITVFLVSIGWDGFGIADFAWTVIILLIGALIGILRLRKDKNIAYGLVLVWAYSGILFKHLSADGFGGQYPAVIAAVTACLALFVFFTVQIINKS